MFRQCTIAGQMPRRFPVGAACGIHNSRGYVVASFTPGRRRRSGSISFLFLCMILAVFLSAGLSVFPTGMYAAIPGTDRQGFGEQLRAMGITAIISYYQGIVALRGLAFVFGPTEPDAAFAHRGAYFLGSLIVHLAEMLVLAPGYMALDGRAYVFSIPEATEWLVIPNAVWCKNLG